MEFNTKEFGITVSNISIHRNKGKSYFSVVIKDEHGGLFDFNVEPKDVRDMFDALGVVVTLTDFAPETAQSTSET